MAKRTNTGPARKTRSSARQRRGKTSGRGSQTLAHRAIAGCAGFLSGFSRSIFKLSSALPIAVVVGVVMVGGLLIGSVGAEAKQWSDMFQKTLSPISTLGGVVNESLKTMTNAGDNINATEYREEGLKWWEDSELYLLTINTADKSNAGTDGDPAIRLVGSRGSTHLIDVNQHLSDADSGDNFERGTAETMLIRAKDIGDMEKIEVTVSGGGMWRPASFVVSRDPHGGNLVYVAAADIEMDDDTGQASFAFNQAPGKVERLRYVARSWAPLLLLFAGLRYRHTLLRLLFGSRRKRGQPTPYTDLRSLTAPLRAGYRSLLRRLRRLKRRRNHRRYA